MLVCYCQRKAPLTNRVQNLGPRHTRVSVCISHVLQHKHVTLRKRYREKQGQAAEYAKLVAKKMEEAKEKCQKETTKRGRLSSASLTLMPVKTKM